MKGSFRPPKKEATAASMDQRGFLTLETLDFYQTPTSHATFASCSLPVKPLKLASNTLESLCALRAH